MNRLLSCIVGISLSVLTQTAISQTTIRVPADSSTIQGAIDRAQNGDTVQVSPGTYNENLDFKGKAITVTSGAKSYADATTIILNGTEDGPVVSFTANETTQTVLNGFTIQNGHASVASGKIGGGIVIDNASPTITNNVVVNNRGCGIFVANEASPLIQGNNIRQTQAQSEPQDTLCRSSVGQVAAGTGIAIIKAGDVKLVSNLIEENGASLTSNSTSGKGVFINSGQRLFMQNNTVRNNHGRVGLSFDEPELTPVHELVLLQNLMYGAGDNGILGAAQQVFISGQFDPPRPIVTEINNTIYGTEEIILPFDVSVVANNAIVGTVEFPATSPLPNSSIYCDNFAGTSPINFDHNNFYQPGRHDASGCTLGTNNISVEPTLRNPTAGDFREQSASLMIAAGDVSAPQIPPADLDAKNRFVCDTIDIGAYEFHPHPLIALSSSANPTPGGSALTFTARLTGNCNVPSGVVTFLDGGVPIGTGTLDGSGVATLATALLVVGQHNITAQYPGDFNFDDSTSDVLVQTTTGDPTTTSLNVSPNPASAFSAITFQSIVSSSYGVPTGSVVFSAGSTVLATSPLDGNGRATATVSTLGAGTYPITARYTADTRFQPSNSPTVQEVVVGADSATVLTAVPNPAAVTQVISFTASVHAARGGTNIPTGTVTLLDGASILGTSALNASGTAVFNISTLSFGTHSITARYEGSSNFNPSSATITEAVTAIGTTLNLSSSPNPSITGQAVTISATAIAGLAGIVPIGTVTFRGGVNVLATVPLDDRGTAAFSISTLAVGTHPIQATLAASPVFAGSTSAVVNQVVQSYDFSLTASHGSLSMPSGDWSVMTVTVTPIGGFKGSVSLSCDGAPDHAQCEFHDGSTVSLANGAKTVNLTVNTSDVYGYGEKVSRSASPSGAGPSLMVRTFAALLFPALGILGWRGRRRRRLRDLWTGCLIVALGVALLGMQACSGKLPGKTPAGTYNLRVVGSTTDGATLNHATSLQLVVTP